MPYYQNKHLLYIHIPKTGGSTIEICLDQNDKKILFSGHGNRLFPNKELQKVSLQHQTIQTLKDYEGLSKIPFNDDLKIISCVRNPYTRLVSDLFHWNLINQKSTKEETYKAIKKYIYKDIYDNHNKPQIQFLLYNNNIIPNIDIIKTETLNSDLENLGYKIKRNYNVGKKSHLNYYDYLNPDSIELINYVYYEDFITFEYKML